MSKPIEKILEWSDLYGIASEDLALLHAKDTALGMTYNNPELLSKILHVNSQLLQQFLAEIPDPDGRSNNTMAIKVDFIAPTSGLRMLGEGYTHPSNAFSEVSNRFFDKDGKSYFDDEVGGLIFSPGPYHVARGFWEGGFQEFVGDHMQSIIEAGYLVYDMCIGDGVNLNEPDKDLDHNKICIGSHCIVYSSTGRGPYNPTSQISFYEDWFWRKKATRALQANIDKFNERVFSREKGSGPNLRADALLANLKMVIERQKS